MLGLVILFFIVVYLVVSLVVVGLAVLWAKKCGRRGWVLVTAKEKGHANGKGQITDSVASWSKQRKEEKRYALPNPTRTAQRSAAHRSAGQQPERIGRVPSLGNRGGSAECGSWNREGCSMRDENRGLSPLVSWQEAA